MISPVIRQEAFVFLQAVLHGVFLTVLYDLLRILRRVIRHGPAAVSAEDFLYWLMAGFFTFCFAFQKTDGIVRGYTALGIILGSVLYHEILSDRLICAAVKVIVVFFQKKRYHKKKVL